MQVRLKRTFVYQGRRYRRGIVDLPSDIMLPPDAEVLDPVEVKNRASAAAKQEALSAKDRAKAAKEAAEKAAEDAKELQKRATEAQAEAEAEAKAEAERKAKEEKKTYAERAKSAQVTL